MNATQKIFSKAGQFIRRNSSTILTVIGAAGVIATTITAVNATPKALRLIEEAKEEKGEELTKLEVVKTTAVCYIPTTVICVTTLACIFSANILDRRHQAALTSAYAVLDRSYKQYRAKIKELYGSDADGNVKCEIAKDNLEKQDIVRTDANKILFYDDYSGRYFESTEAKVIEAEYQANRTILNEGFLTLAEFYSHLGLTVDDDSWNYVGWTIDDLCEWTGYYWLDFHNEKTTMEDGLEATIIWYDISPSLEYLDEYIDIPEDVKNKFDASSSR